MIAKRAAYVGLTTAVFTAFGATLVAPAHAAPATTGNVWSISQSSPSGDANIDFVGCRIITANDLTVFYNSTGSDSFAHVYKNNNVNVVSGPSGNNRYHINFPYDGWISANPDWSKPC